MKKKYIRERMTNDTNELISSNIYRFFEFM